MLEQTLTPGMLLDVTWGSGQRKQSWVGRVHRIDRSVIIGEPLATQMLLPDPGTTVRLTTAIGSWPTKVTSKGAGLVVFERPGAVVLTNRRASLRVRVQASAHWRPHPDGPVYAVFVEDLSLQGVRILSERVNGIGPGSTVVGIFAGHEGLGEVRSVQPHPNERLAFYGVRFVTIPDGLARIVRKVVASARQDPASWW